MSLKSEEIGGVDLKIPTTYSFIIYFNKVQKCDKRTDGQTAHTAPADSVPRGKKARRLLDATDSGLARR